MQHDMFYDIRNHLSTATAMLDKYNSVTDMLFRAKAGFVDTGDMTFFSNQYLRYNCRNVYREKRPYNGECIIMMGLIDANTQEEETESVRRTALHTAPYQSYRTETFVNAFDIPEEELFQLSTLYTDLQLCNLYLKEYYNRIAVYNFNVRINTTFDPDNVLFDETEKFRYCIEDLHSFEHAYLTGNYYS